MSGSGREVIRDIREWVGDPNGWSGGLPRCPVVVGKSSRMFGSGREPSQLSWSDREALPGDLE